MLLVMPMVGRDDHRADLLQHLIDLRRIGLDDLAPTRVLASVWRCCGYASRRRCARLADRRKSAQLARVPERFTISAHFFPSPRM